MENRAEFNKKQFDNDKQKKVDFFSDLFLTLQVDKLFRAMSKISIVFESGTDFSYELLLKDLSNMGKEFKDIDFLEEIFLDVLKKTDFKSKNLAGNNLFMHLLINCNLPTEIVEDLIPRVDLSIFNNQGNNTCYLILHKNYEISSEKMEYLIENSVLYVDQKYLRSTVLSVIFNRSDLSEDLWLKILRKSGDGIYRFNWTFSASFLDYFVKNMFEKGFIKTEKGLNNLCEIIDLRKVKDHSIADLIKKLRVNLKLNASLSIKSKNKDKNKRLGNKI